MPSPFLFVSSLCMGRVFGGRFSGIGAIFPLIFRYWDYFYTLAV